MTTPKSLIGRYCRVPTKSNPDKFWRVQVIEMHSSGRFVKVEHDGAIGPQKAWWVEVEALTHPRKNQPLLADQSFDLATHLRRQRSWSDQTFGPGARSAGVIDHIRKELREIEDNPTDLEEWIDVIILAFDGATRAGHSPEDVIAALVAKQEKNEARQWPDWRTQPVDQAITHVKEDAI